MKKHKFLTAVGVVALTASLGIAGEGKFGNHRGHGRHHGEFSEKLAAKLNLTDAQKQQAKDLNTRFREENKAFFQSARATMKEFRAAKEAGDTAKADSLKNTVEQNHAHMKQLREAQRSQFLSILTADQRAQFDAMKAERKQHRQ
ncbi:MAG TPA: Spy/CpxP family protein refolding chaperone [Thermoanaerobaculia bacterium]|nr:Spy/CpxP family protein refolding chaperone [Thermoanaerobaculia bacterium]